MFSIFLKSCELLSARSKGAWSGVVFGMVGEGVGGWRGESGCCSGRGMVVVGDCSGKSRSSVAMLALI